MTASCWPAPSEAPTTRAVLVLDTGEVLFDDVRQFGSVGGCGRRRVTSAGCAGDFGGRVRRPSAHAQGAVEGAAAETGFLRGWATSTPTSRCSARASIRWRSPRAEPEARAQLHKAIREVLFDAIAKGGSSISDYVDANAARARSKPSTVYQGRANPV